MCQLWEHIVLAVYEGELTVSYPKIEVTMNEPTASYR
jgi:hypothetical protein